MYAVYADNQLLYSPDMVDDGYIITEPVLTKEMNKSGSFEFKIFDSNPHFSTLSPLKTQIRVTDNDEEIWRGRVLNIEKDFDNRRAVYCEGVLSFLVDSIIRPYTKVNRSMADQFRYYISKHNEMVEAYKQFTIKTIDVDDLYGNIDWESTSYEKTNDVIDSLVSNYGGYLVVGYEDGQNTISYLKNPGRESIQTINFGENLLDVTETIDSSSVFTALIPIGYDANNNKITIESVNQGNDYIVSETGADKFGIIFFQYTFEQVISTPSELLTIAQDFLSKNINIYRTISLKALDLHLIDPSINKFDVYDIIKVESDPHGINEYEMCTMVSIDLENPEDSEYTIGTIPEGITDSINSTQKVVISGSGGSSLPNGDNVAY